MIFNKNIIFTFLKEKRENIMKMQIDPIFNNNPEQKKPAILTNISNFRIRNKIAMLKNIANTLYFFNFVIISKYLRVIPTTAKGKNSKICPKEYIIKFEYLLKKYKFQ